MQLLQCMLVTPDFEIIKDPIDDKCVDNVCCWRENLSSTHNKSASPNLNGYIINNEERLGKILEIV